MPAADAFGTNAQTRGDLTLRSVKAGAEELCESKVLAPKGRPRPFDFAECEVWKPKATSACRFNAKREFRAASRPAVAQECFSWVAIGGTGLLVKGFVPSCHQRMLG
mmetsp:Transcript_21122/g.59064  ORF Transcript_21122/g.59064 Transcript_21122/m.59064 type:complete len:107 (+) Transcript_21122:770-1090(+)